VYVMALFDAPTVATFSEYLSAAYPDAVARLGGQAVQVDLAAGGALAVEPALEKLRAAVSRRLGRALTPVPSPGPPEHALPGRGAPPTDPSKSPPLPGRADWEDRERGPGGEGSVVFLLSPFRSGSTLLR